MKYEITDGNLIENKQQQFASNHFSSSSIEFIISFT